MGRPAHTRASYIAREGWNLQRRIKATGAKDQVRRAMAAANATDDTKKYGQMLLDKLAQC